MEDLRKIQKQNEIKQKIRFDKIKNWFLDNYKYIIYITIILFIVLFPNIIGDFFGYWWKSFSNSFIN